MTENGTEVSTDTVDRETDEKDEDLDLADLLVDLTTLLCGKSLDGPPATEVRYKRVENTLSLAIHVKDTGDTGAVIGREGSTIRAIRHIFQCIGGARKSHYITDIVAAPRSPQDSKEKKS